LNLKIKGVDFVSNLNVLNSKGIDVILGIDWLSKHKIPIKVLRSPLKLTTSNRNELEHITESVVTAKGATNHVKLTRSDANPIPYVPMVNEFIDVFFEEWSVMPPDRDIKFVIE
jgi:hypothetical protein